MSRRASAPVDRHPRLESYGGRVAEVVTDGCQVGWVLVIASWCARQLGGHLWWSRWAPVQHAVESWVFLPGAGADLDTVTVERHDPRSTHHVAGPQILEAELDRYDEGILTIGGGVRPALARRSAVALGGPAGLGLARPRVLTARQHHPEDGGSSASRPVRARHPREGPRAMISVDVDPQLLERARVLTDLPQELGAPSTRAPGARPVTSGAP